MIMNLSRNVFLFSKLGRHGIEKFPRKCSTWFNILSRVFISCQSEEINKYFWNFFGVKTRLWWNKNKCILNVHRDKVISCRRKTMTSYQHAELCGEHRRWCLFWQARYRKTSPVPFCVIYFYHIALWHQPSPHRMIFSPNAFSSSKTRKKSLEWFSG